ncbi:MAG: DUF3320 domain-containing protein [Alphaproteobacteria bacterium]|nr:DUF3320 domain-containing protein [Alphaproteobacteria bacterium]
MATVAAQLETSRQALLDLSLRNRLLNVPRQKKSAKTIEICDEKATETYRLLVSEGKTLTFLPGREKQKAAVDTNIDPAAQPQEDDDFGELPQPEDDEVSENGVAQRHQDHRLQTLLTSEGLQKRLLSLYYDARTFEEEQGVNILYLAIGMLKWFEAESSDEARYAPLFLVPVTLDRGNAAQKFKLRWRNEDCAANLSLQAKLKAEFGLVLPDLPQTDELDISAFMNSIRMAVEAHKRFEVIEDDMVLGFFSFAKFLMYRDLAPEVWPDDGKIDKNALVAGLLTDGFPVTDGMIGEDENIDQFLPPERILHVMDADSSQALAIEEVRRGRNLVIQGPPGTGKSQTITNIIANAVADGKKVLFVAEKMSALEVVFRRMTNIGLGSLCLELHSNKSNKRAVLEEIQRTREIGRPKNCNGQETLAQLASLRNKLNEHAKVLHQQHQPSGLTAYQIIGESVRLRQNKIDVRGVVLECPENWSAADKKDKKERLADITARIKEIGFPVQHPWRGVRRSQLLPNEYDRLCDSLSDLQNLFEAILNNAVEVEQKIPSTESTLHSLNVAASAAKAASNLPEADISAFGDSLWQNGLSLLGDIVQSGCKYSALAERLAKDATQLAWSTDLTGCRTQIALHGKSFLRVFFPSYRQAIVLLTSIASGPLPKKYEDRLAFADDIISAQQLAALLKEHDEAGRKAFGKLWQGTHSDWAKLDNVLAWRKSVPDTLSPNDFLVSCSKIENAPTLSVPASSLEKLLPEFFSKLSELFRTLQLDVRAAFDVSTVEAINRDALHERLTSWARNTESLSKWISFNGRYDAICEGGLRTLGERLWKGTLLPDEAHDVFERAYYDTLTEVVFTEHPLLREFDGELHANLVENFRANDLHRIEQARIEIRQKHYNSLPRSEGGIGALGILNGEISKKRNHLPIRQLLKHAGLAIQAIKPVFMMSPLSVAQFLEPGSMTFDLLVMDEASQVEPVDALGAIARAKQIVVVGDSRQLPPTKFFSRVTDNANDNDDDDNAALAVQDVESVLNLCVARGFPQSMLRWHYRSRHQSLIAVSNREFYENRLFIIPSPYDAASGMGLKFNYLPQATFDSGGTATNPQEAKAVAKAVIQHAKDYPHLSLGVGTFSIKQKQAIIDELELLRRMHPETETFFTQAHIDEPFFVKNLENIQGDERDVIFISVGYGRNSSGYMAMRFGPLSSEGGERRLNVLISRAKRRCELFSSITADDIDLERAKGAGVSSLKLFLKFAQTGKLDFGRTTEREADSVFEEQVAAALRTRGYDVKTQIGIAGFFVDLGIVDPEKPGRFVLGIECDGASYHSSRSARDRDRLRQAVLEDHGWIIHRIWSTDWFRRPNEQLEKTVAAVEQAKKNLVAQEQEDERPKAKQVFEIVSYDDGNMLNVLVSVGEKSLSVPYQEAVVPVPSHREPHELGDNEMAEIVAKIVEAEMPVHESEIITRVRTLWNLGRAGSRIQDKVKAGLAHAVRRNLVAKDGEFYFKQDAEIKVRDRGAVSSLGLKKPENLPPSEIKKAVLTVIETNFGAEREQLPTEILRLFGFKSSSAQLREVIEAQIQDLLTQERLCQKGNTLLMCEGKKAVGH